MNSATLAAPLRQRASHTCQVQSLSEAQRTVVVETRIIGVASLALSTQIRDSNVDDTMRKRRDHDSDSDAPAKPRKRLQTDKRDLTSAYDVAKVSTASMGRFDKYASFPLLFVCGKDVLHAF